MDGPLILLILLFCLWQRGVTEQRQDKIQIASENSLRNWFYRQRMWNLELGNHVHECEVRKGKKEGVKEQQSKRNGTNQKMTLWKQRRRVSSRWDFYLWPKWMLHSFIRTEASFAYGLSNISHKPNIWWPCQHFSVVLGSLLANSSAHSSKLKSWPLNSKGPSSWGAHHYPFFLPLVWFLFSLSRKAKICCDDFEIIAMYQASQS